MNLIAPIPATQPRFHIGEGRYESMVNSRFNDYDFKEEIATSIDIELPEKGHGTYGQLLFDVHWRNRREEILIRDNRCCVICSNSESLQVHHRQYHFILALRQFKSPWDYEDYLMISLCERCHAKGHARFRVPIIYL